MATPAAAPPTLAKETASVAGNALTHLMGETAALIFSTSCADVPETAAASSGDVVPCSWYETDDDDDIRNYWNNNHGKGRQDDSQENLSRTDILFSELKRKIPAIVALVFFVVVCLVILTYKVVRARERRGREEAGAGDGQRRRRCRECPEENNATEAGNSGQFGGWLWRAWTRQRGRENAQQRGRPFTQPPPSYDEVMAKDLAELPTYEEAMKQRQEHGIALPLLEEALPRLGESLPLQEETRSDERAFLVTNEQLPESATTTTTPRPRSVSTTALPAAAATHPNLAPHPHINTSLAIVCDG